MRSRGGRRDLRADRTSCADRGSPFPDRSHLLALQPGLTDHPGILVELCLKKGRKLFRPARRESAPLDRNAALDLGIVHRLEQGGMQRVHDLARRLARREQPVPLRELVSGQARFRHRRNFGQEIGARGAGDRQRPHAAGLDVRQCGCRSGESKVDLPRYELGRKQFGVIWSGLLHPI